MFLYNRLLIMKKQNTDSAGQLRKNGIVIGNDCVNKPLYKPTGFVKNRVDLFC